MRSLRHRLNLLYTVTALGLLAALGLATYLHLNHELREESLERTHPGHPDWVLHGNFSRAEVNDVVGELFVVWAMVGIPLLAASVAAGWWLAGKSTRPFEELNAQIGSIGPESLSTRVSTTEQDPNLQLMVHRVNELLDRVQHGFERLDSFAAMVAHELRTPIMVMRTRLESSESAIDPALAEDMQEELSRLAGYIERCLVSARAENNHLVMRIESVNLWSLAVELAEAHGLMAREEGRSLVLDRRDTPTVLLDPDLFRQMLDNLLVNALQHGEGDMALRIRTCGSHAVVLVANRRSKSATRRGNGIGLRLVRALAAALPDSRLVCHRGTKWFAVRLFLPLEGPADHAPGVRPAPQTRKHRETMVRFL